MINIFKVRVLIIVILLFGFSNTTFSMNKTLKGSLIGLGTGFVISSAITFYATYDFQRGRFTTDPMPLVTGWAVLVPVSSIIGCFTGGMIGYFSKE